MTIDEAFSATGFFFEELLAKDESLRDEFNEALNAGNKPYMWQGLKGSLHGNFLVMTVTTAPEA